MFEILYLGQRFPVHAGTANVNVLPVHYPKWGKQSSSGEGRHVDVVHFCIWGRQTAMWAMVWELLSTQPWQEICLSFNTGINNIAHSWCFDLVHSLEGLEQRKAQRVMPVYDRWMPVCVILQCLPQENCFSTVFSTSAKGNQCNT